MQAGKLSATLFQMKIWAYLGLILIVASFLRLYNLGNNPPSLYWDEASLGYNAYSILKTGKDEHERFLPLDTFPAFGDYKPPGYIYAAVPSIALFGTTEFAVRLPSAFFGILAVYLIYLLGSLLFSRKVGLVAAILLTISPWHLQVSRAAFESNLATTLIIFAVFAWIKAIKGNSWWYLPATVSSALSMHTFNAQRVMVPIMGLAFSFFFWKEILQSWKKYSLAVIIGVLIVLPMLPHVLSSEGQLRYREVNIFSDVDLITKNVYRSSEDKGILWSQLMHNRRLEFAYQFLDHYLDHFNWDFLFVRGDENPRLSTQVVGSLYFVEMVSILFGVYVLFRRKYKYRWVLLVWMLIAPIPAGMARETPHVLRALSLMPVFTLLSALGSVTLVQCFSKRRIWVMFVVLGLLGLSALTYLHYYHSHYPIEHGGDWQYGYKQVVELAKSYPNKKVVITAKYGRPYIYFLYFAAYDPRQYWQYANQRYKDSYGVYGVTGFDRFEFRESDFSKESLDNSTLYIVAPGELPPGDSSSVKRIAYPDGRIAFEAAVR